MRRSAFIFGLLTGALLLPAATLEQLSLEQMIDKSTGIVQGRVAGSSPLVRNSIIYTCYQLQVTQSWKGSSAAQQTVCVPGGQAQGLRQAFGGAPALQRDQEYVVFLWAGKSGMNQVIGLSQGLFDVKEFQGQLMAGRPGSDEVVIDAQGRRVADAGVLMKLADLTGKIRSRLAAAKDVK